ncbi:hypothetical protein G647_05210 [Cladophialophora carrionii CBS 160.54]|uniref:DUF2423 domain-containing protein n=1 Tax=Cladophialophora carrionii CBS 160.54 TaxID=1279043 RepID=V9DAU0_9EURO|nr:uncharacterized protein G647_05210 [Cladophialophora carrionii CBS 160.54]ETI23408.1 hypothetical protein G647_05210 [Cladophialophora carrionii CBS 160.54]
MAKSARATVVKKNRRALRATVFGPAHDARTARLSAKLQELAAKPKPETEKSMDVDERNGEDAEDQPRTDGNEEMDIDAQGAKMKAVRSASGKNRVNRKAHKISKKKPRNSMVFPSEIARRKKMAIKKTKR